MTAGSQDPRLHLDSAGVRARFRHALRQGNSEWLWPDTTPEGWQAALRAVDQVVRAVLTGNAPVPILEGNAQDIGIAAFTSGMGPLLGFWASEDLLRADASVRAVLDLHYTHNLERMRALAASARKAVEALSAGGIEVTVLKGMHTAFTFFPTPGCRPMSDIDLLVAPVQDRKACSILQSLDFVHVAGSYGEKTFRLKGLVAEPRSLSFLHRDDPWSIDLHTTLNRRYSPGAPMIRMDRALRNTKPGAWALSPNARVLTGEELVVQLACHASGGLGSLSLLRMTELSLVIRKLETEGRLSWDRVVQTVERSGVSSCIYPALAMVAQLVPGTVPDSILRTLEREAPVAVRKVIAGLQPATCQRLLRNSFAERFMWIDTGYGWAREIFLSLFPPVSVGQMLQIYKRRFFILWRGRFSS